jgi:hypothetical protein
MVFGLQVEHVGGNGRHLGGELLTSSAPDTNANPFPPFPGCDARQPENSFTLTHHVCRSQKKKKQKEKGLWKSGSPNGSTFPQALLLRRLEQTLLSLTPPNVQGHKGHQEFISKELIALFPFDSFPL